jgi:phosphotransferase system, enzyme I, PtsP
MMIFSSHLLMLRDESFVGRMEELANEGTDPREAVQAVVDDFSQRFAAIPDPRFQEKVQDVQDLGHRIVRNLHALEEMDSDYRGQVIVSGEIFPSELVKLHLQNVEGLVFSGGSATSHVAILAQSLGLPVVAIPDRRLFCIPPGTRLVVDAEDGKLVVNPAPEILEAYRQRVRIMARDTATPHEDADHPLAISTPVYTTDGTRIYVLANVNLVKDAISAASLGAEGVGLYRSEFPFLIRNGFPVEDEQVTVYRRVVTAMEGRPVSFRTLDLGGDKLLSSQVGREDNPFLGFRGIRFLLGHRDLLRDQLRAMLRAGHDADIGIQFPMVASLEEFLAAREEVYHSITSLREEGLEHNDHPRLGVMVELPATLEIAADLAEVVDFFSIGSNDLTMYMLAADRTNHRVAGLYRSIHPGVLRALARFIAVSTTCGTPVSVCGANAADTAMVCFYLGAGITQLSVDPSEIPRLARALARIDLAEARSVAEKMLATRTASEMSIIVEGIRGSFTD